ncbi:MAG: methyltransferase domain-containing protein [Oscillospiraceae bacterium]
MSLFCCPVCGAPLVRGEKNYVCPNGHGYDRAREGYVHLLPANHIHSKAPGDDKDMVSARNRFLSGGWYLPLREELCKLAIAHAPDNCALLDSGCGEGYYTSGLFEALTAAGKNPCAAGVDLSKPSLKYAARRAQEVEFAVASVYHLPVLDCSADLLINCFSPLALDEFRRVLKPGGVFLYVVPAADHLWELKSVLYENPYQNPEENILYEGFAYEEVREVKTLMPINSGAKLNDLFRMTPYFWKTPKTGSDRLAALEALDVTASFRVHVFRREG